MFVVVWCSTSRRQNRLPTATLTVGSTTVTPVSSVRNLGIFVDSNLVTRTHVCETVSRCFAAMRQLRSTRHLISATVFQSLVTALVLSQLDYGNGTLVGLPTHLLCRLQSVQNAAARLILRLRRSDHITDALMSLHWLQVPKQIVYKVTVQTCQALHGDTPQYLWQFTPVADIPTRQRLRSSTLDDLCVPAVRLPTVGRHAFFVAVALCLERSSCGRHFSTFSTHFLKTFKTASLLTLLSWPCPLNHVFLIAWSLL